MVSGARRGEGGTMKLDNDLTQVDNSTSYCDKSISFYDNNKCMNEPVERHVEKVEKRGGAKLMKNQKYIKIYR